MSQPHAPSRHRSVLHNVAERAMVERGLLPAFSGPALAELQQLGDGTGSDPGPVGRGGAIRDLTALPWSSIDNDSSRDLDQLTVAETGPNGVITVRVAIADVDALVPQGSALDAHARRNTTSVYTAATVFPMLPELLSTNLTSLNPGQTRLAVVVEMQIDASGAVLRSALYRARGPQSRQAGLQRRGGLARGHGGHAAAHGRCARSGR